MLTACMFDTQINQICTSVQLPSKLGWTGAGRQIGKCRAMQACMRRARSDRSSETIDEGSIEERKSLPVALRKESTFCLHACSMTTKGCYPSLWPPSDFSSTPPSTVANDHTSFHLHTSLKGTSSFPNYVWLCLWSNKWNFSNFIDKLYRKYMH